MENVNDVKEIDINTKEGKLLIAAIAVLTTVRPDDLHENKWGRSLNYNTALAKLSEMTSKMFQKNYRTEGIRRVKMQRQAKS